MDRPQGGRMSSKDVDMPDRYVTKSFSQNPFPLKTKYPFPHKTKYYVYLQIYVLALLSIEKTVPVPWNLVWGLHPYKN